jgi:Uma2 family endonuclease
VTGWLAAGTKLVWVVYPNRQTVSVHRAGRVAEVMVVGQSLSGEDAIAGFKCAVGEMFS